MPNTCQYIPILNTNGGETSRVNEYHKYGLACIWYVLVCIDLYTTNTIQTNTDHMEKFIWDCIGLYLYVMVCMKLYCGVLMCIVVY